MGGSHATPAKTAECYPSVKTLATELATSERQTQRYLRELERNELIKRIPRISESGQTSSIYVFLWHQLFEEGVTDTSPEGVTNMTPEGVTAPSPKESQTEESHSEETNIDLDFRRANRKNRDSRPDVRCWFVLLQAVSKIARSARGVHGHPGRR